MILVKREKMIWEGPPILLTMVQMSVTDDARLIFNDQLNEVRSV